MKQKMKWNKLVTLFAILTMGIANMIPTIQVFAETTQSSAVAQKEEKEITTQERETNVLSEPKELFKNEQELIAEQNNPMGESSNANDSPLVMDEHLVDIEEMGSLTFDENGVMLYNNAPVYVGAGNEEIPANINELMKAGVPTMMRAAIGGASIEYLGQVSYSYSVVGLFTVNGKVAFCLQHPKPTPGTGTPNNGLEPYTNANIQRILYYGWGGPGNIFTDSNQGIVVTSLVLSKYYNGDISDSGAPGWAELDNLAQNGEIKSHKIQINNLNTLVDLPVNIKGNKQVSSVATLNADKDNYIDVNIPQGMTYVSETTGETATNKTVRIYGGQKYHLEADLTYTNNFKSGTKNGFVKEFQPLVIRPTASGYQELGTWRWYDDPSQEVSFSANFFARTGDFELLKLSETTNKPLAGVVFAVTIDGQTKEYTTDEAGKIKINDILNGKVVTYKEVSAPKGYAIDPTEHQDTIVAGQVLTVTVTNSIEKFTITGQKQKEIFKEKETFKEGKPVYENVAGENITFDIKALTDITLPDGTVAVEKDAIVDTVTTDKDGKFTSKELLAGEQNQYQLVERDVPDNYRQPTEEQTIFSHSYGDGTQEIFNYELENPINNELKTGEWKINKKNELTGLGLDGARFHLVGISDNVKDVQFIFVSSALGNTFKLKEGTYKVSEVEFPNGFTQAFGESESKIIVIKDNETLVTDWNNSPVEAKQPKMGTMAYVENGGKDFDPTVDNKLYDKISTLNFESDSYFFVTKVIGEKTGKVYSETKGIQKLDKNGEVIVETMIPANTIQNENIYFVEEAYPTKEDHENGKPPYSKHDGKGDYGQTLFYKTKPVTPKTPTPKTPTTPTTPKGPTTPNTVGTLPKTGESTPNYFIMIIGLLLVLVASVYYYQKKKTGRNSSL